MNSWGSVSSTGGFDPRVQRGSPPRHEALRVDQVPRDGAFDSAAANGLAAIIAYKESSREYEDSGNRVKAPLALLSIVKTSASEGEATG